MNTSSDKIKVLDCSAGDNEYLHKDFHGALCYIIKYLDEVYGAETLEEYLEQLAKSYYSPLIEKLKEKALPALENHWKDIFTREGGKFSLHYENNTLVLNVDECPAIAHLKKTGQFFTHRYCQTTVVVNKTICHEAGYDCTCQYEPGRGRCVQKFWKP